MSKTSIMYSSHPISNYSLGRFKFDKTVLTLDNEQDISEFEKLYESLPPAEKNRIKKIDVDAAERFVQGVLAQMPKPTQTIDSSLGGEATRSVGTGNLLDQVNGEHHETGSDDSLASNTNYSNAGEDAPATTSDFVPNRENLSNAGVIVNQDAPAGSGDTTSGENHGAGNFDGANNLDVQELKEIAASQGSELNADQRAALDLLQEAGGVNQDGGDTSAPASAKPESESTQTETDALKAEDKKPAGLGGLLNRGK